MGPLLVLQRAYRREPSVTCLILRLAGDTMEAHVSFLQVWHEPELKPEPTPLGMQLQMTAQFAFEQQDSHCQRVHGIKIKSYWEVSCLPSSIWR